MSPAKPEPESFSDVSIEGIALKRLGQLVRPLSRPNELVRFPAVFERICAVLCLTKKEAWEVLRRLEAKGAIEIVPYQGIRIRRPSDGFVTGLRAGQHHDNPRLRVRRRVLSYLRKKKSAYPSEIAVALNLDIDTVIATARRLVREGAVEA